MDLQLKANFKSDEIAILRLFDRSIKSEFRELFREQMATVKSLGREHKNSSVNMYSRKFWKITRVGGGAFPELPEEYLAGKFTKKNAKPYMTAELWFVHGRPFSVEFSGNIDSQCALEWEVEISDYFREDTRG